ncbi:MAG: ADP-forming succinate--CoA ligase subunit beta [Candidatus Omnitrophota bacterium]
MKIHEYQARLFFQKAGIPVVNAEITTELSQAQSVAKTLGFPVVLKSQVLVGGRGKAGGIKVVKTPQELEQTYLALKKLSIKGFQVEKILVAQAIDIKKEFYLAITVDNTKNDAVIIFSAAGGIDIEETAKTAPEKIQKFYLEGKKEIDQARWPSFIEKSFSDKPSQEKATAIIKALVALFYQNDCSLAEINPLVIDATGTWYAADGKMIFDDNALGRHPDFAQLRDRLYEDADEMEAKEHDLSFVKLDGNVGCIVNGAGLAMATTDIIKFFGGEPANFLDVGGSSNPQKVLNALKIILRNKSVKVILINIFGGITRCDDIAKGILEAKKQYTIPVPLVVRLTGTNEKEAKELLAKENINIHTSMREAVKEVVRLAKV